MSVILGGIITVIINKGAMKKQSHFDMRRKIIEELLEQSQRFQKDLEYLEISISFNKLHGSDYHEFVDKVQTSCLLLNEALRTKRKFVNKYVKAVTVEESAELVSDFLKTMCYFGDGGISDITNKETIDYDMINGLRLMSSDAKGLCNALTESLERLVSPGILARIGRLTRPARSFLSECYAIWKVRGKKQKKNKRNISFAKRVFLSALGFIAFTGDKSAKAAMDEMIKTQLYGEMDKEIARDAGTIPEDK